MCNIFDLIFDLKQKSLEERQRERMEKRQARLGRQQSMDAISRRCLASVRYTGMRQPKFVEDHNLNMVMVHDHKGQQAVPTRLENL